MVEIEPVVQKTRVSLFPNGPFPAHLCPTCREDTNGCVVVLAEGPTFPTSLCGFCALLEFGEYGDGC
jgi:hypothetical protein